MFSYVSKEWATKTNMSYINAQGQAIMSVDNWSVLAPGQARNSVRIESRDVFNKGLFILDVEQAPWGWVYHFIYLYSSCSSPAELFLPTLENHRCGVWPAWWTVCVFFLQYYFETEDLDN